LRAVKRTKSKGTAGNGRKTPVKVTGTIVTGLGVSASFLAIPWVKDQLSKSLSFAPYCGTLNIELQDPEVQKALKSRSGKKVLPAEKGFCEALLFEGTVAGRFPCGIILPLVVNYPENVLEIIAPVHLKQALGISDGDRIEVELEVS